MPNETNFIDNGLIKILEQLHSLFIIIDDFNAHKEYIDLYQPTYVVNQSKK